MRKGIVITAIILVFGLIAGSVYFFFLGGQKNVSDILKNTPQNSNEPKVSNTVNTAEVAKGIYAISGKKIISPVFSHDFETIWYFDEQGKLFKNNLEGTAEEEFIIADTAGVTRAFWPQKGNDFIVEFLADGSTRRFRWFDSRVLNLVDLPNSVEHIAWLADGKQVVYVWKKSDGGSELKISSPDTESYTKVADVSYSYNLIPSPEQNIIYVYSDPEAGARDNFVYKVNIDTGQFEEFLDRGINTGVLPSPDSTKLLFTRLNVLGKPELWLHDFSKESFENLKIQTTINKVAFSPDSAAIIYAESLSAPVESSGNLLSGEEIFYLSLDTRVQVSQNTARLGSAVNVSDLLVGPRQEAVFFRNNLDGRLYRLNIEN